MNRFFIPAGMTLALLCAGQSWAQSTAATGTYLGQKVPPVLAVELDAATSRATPTASGPATGSVGIQRERERDNAASVPTYTGTQNSQSMGNAMPSPSTDSSTRR